MEAWGAEIKWLKTAYMAFKKPCTIRKYHEKRGTEKGNLITAVIQGCYALLLVLLAFLGMGAIV